MTVLRLEPDTDPQEIVATLEELLRRAKDGEFEAIVAVCLRPNGNFMTRSSGYRNSMQVVGALHFAQHDLIMISS
jgi:hypothetical protein